LDDSQQDEVKESVHKIHTEGGGNENGGNSVKDGNGGVEMFRGPDGTRKPLIRIGTEKGVHPICANVRPNKVYVDSPARPPVHAVVHSVIHVGKEVNKSSLLGDLKTAIGSFDYRDITRDRKESDVVHSHNRDQMSLLTLSDMNKRGVDGAADKVTGLG